MYGCQYYHAAVSIFMLEAYKKFKFAWTVFLAS